MIVGRPQRAVKPGSVIADKYRVEKELGRGAFGVVVRAVHLTLGQTVAIKVLMPGEGGDSAWKEDAARFRREAQAIAALRGEHIVRILDVDVLEDGCPYMVMEYLEGETLHSLVHTRGPLAIADAVDYVVQVLAALAEAHAAGIVHRDLKPANIFLAKGPGGSPVVKILDFGVSKVGAGLGSMQAITKTGAVIGTVAYMAPEQMIDAKRVDARADLWSAGMILYESLTRQLPFGQANAPTIVSSTLTQQPAPLWSACPHAPPRLEAVVMRCLEKEPEKRYATAAAIAKALAEFASPRARSALESLRRAGPPSGAAAPERAREKGGPLVPVARAAGADGGRVALWMGAAGAVATVTLLGLATVVVMAGPKVAEPGMRKVEAGAEAGRSPRAGAGAGAGAQAPADEEIVSVGALARAEAGAGGPGVPSLGTGPAPAVKMTGDAASASAASASPCNPPFAFDENGIKRYKPDCLE